jgi:hypothetical protein
MYNKLKDKIYTMLIEGDNYKIYISRDYIYIQDQLSKLYHGYENNEMMLDYILENRIPIKITVLTDKPGVIHERDISIIYSNKPFGNISSSNISLNLNSYTEFPKL